MRVQCTTPMRVSLALALLATVCVSQIAPPPAPPDAQAAPPPRQLVTDPMTWLVPTAHGWQPAELAQPTLWIEGQPVTRMVIERPGMERSLILPR